MPVLRYQNQNGQMESLWLDLFSGGDGQIVPLTIGSSEQALGHLHLPGQLPQRVAQIDGSGVVSAYSFVLTGIPDQIRINDHRLETLRVLRHGDHLEIGGTPLLYLDFAPRELTEGSKLLECGCALQGCDQGVFKAGDEIIQCPWCGCTYHSTCWLKLERCAAHRDCYWVRQMLLSELSGQVKLEKLPEQSNHYPEKCAARCTINNQLIKEGDEVIRCLECKKPYHPACWLSYQGECQECGADIRGVIDHAVFHLEAKA